ncbi:MAG: cytochrome c biogenesis protein CcsA [Janthinobacterium lividum]
MINEIGNGLQICAAALAISAIFSSNIRIAKLASYLSSVLIILSFLSLVYGFIVSDFSILNVFLNSSTVKPLIFKISGAWASHEGSMLLWLSLLCLVNIIYLKQIRKEYIIKIQVIFISIIKLLFIIFIYFTSNPFIKVSAIPQEGLGLNPALQDVALFIHPPILYFGYVCLIIPFINAIIGCRNCNNLSKLSLLESSKFFSGLSLIFMTTGIGLGSWWAYRELGWGGYWFFDPVENISLLPWLSAIALHHSLATSIKYDKLIMWTWSFSIITFWLVIFGTFLVRSGLLTSVHSFAASKERAIYLFIILIVITKIGSVTLFFHYQQKKLDANSSYNQTGIKIGNILWSISIIILVLSILYPLIHILFGSESVSLDVNFFLTNFVPVILATIFAAGIFTTRLSNISLIIVILVLITAIISSYFIRYNYIAAAAVLASLYLIFQTIYIFFANNYLGSENSTNFISMIVSHLGCGLLALCITLNCSTQDEFEFSGLIGENKNFNQFNISLKNIKFAEADNYYRQIAEFWILDKNNNIVTILKPENRYYKIEKSLSQESDIYSYLTHDIYGVLSKIDGEVVSAKIYYRPMMSFIWLSMLIIVGGLLIGQFANSSRNLKLF